jgi:hypothetical protein
MNSTLTEAPEDGVYYRFTDDNGRWVDLVPTVTGGGAIHRGPANTLTYDEEFMFDTFTRAESAYFLFWLANDPKVEPDGWVRHKPSDRRRPAGDAALEYRSA